MLGARCADGWLLGVGGGPKWTASWRKAAAVRATEAPRKKRPRTWLEASVHECPDLDSFATSGSHCRLLTPTNEEATHRCVPLPPNDDVPPSQQQSPSAVPEAEANIQCALHAYTRHDMRMGRLRGDYAACVSSRLCFFVRAGSVHKLCNASTVQTGRPSGRDCGSRPRTCARGSPPFTSLRSAPEGLRCSCSAAVLNCRRACLPTSQAARLQPALRALKSLGRYPWQVDAQKGARGGLTCRCSCMSVFVHV